MFRENWPLSLVPFHYICSSPSEMCIWRSDPQARAIDSLAQLWDPHLPFLFLDWTQAGLPLKSKLFRQSCWFYMFIMESKYHQVIGSSLEKWFGYYITNNINPISSSVIVISVSGSCIFLCELFSLQSSKKLVWKIPAKHKWPLAGNTPQRQGCLDSWY